MPDQTFIVGEGGIVAYRVPAERGKKVTLVTSGDLLYFATDHLNGNFHEAQGLVEPGRSFTFTEPVWVESEGSTVISTFEDGSHAFVGAVSAEVKPGASHHAKVAVYDEAGNALGFIPIYRDL